MRQAWVRQGPGELIDVVDAGDKVVLIMRPASDETGPAATAANVTTFRDGKVVEMVHYPDPGDALAAAGVET
jgi:ketosteroid isomerase-like protein